ncbi:hypothetical protein GCM10020358_02580 [Amorphoplanes nipponensis]|uniref:Lipoprotein n=1 Tax=Actinoplanes nipponensis TaxID=135950 RepID=A0A919MGB3_9ACTN|nr:hypothetical protein [Actinoplanes nipponensis]GIE48409.1 hypothetical protein Ani05nite_19430 [Actinoplanes nipponensis]
MPSRLPRLLAVTGLAVSVLTLTACSQQSPDKAAAPPAAAPVATAEFGDGPAPTAATATPAATPSAPPAPLLADGRWPGYLKKVSSDAVSMDLVEFLTGEAAAKAWQKKYPDSGQDTPDNDYFIVNDNTKLRKLPLSPDVVVKAVGKAGPGTEDTITVAAIPKHYGTLLNGTLFWFTVKKGEVTRIEEQFLP